jgi:hypothetical protein
MLDEVKAGKLDALWRRPPLEVPERMPDDRGYTCMLMMS